MLGLAEASPRDSISLIIGSELSRQCIQTESYTVVCIPR
jgi:hypothetical protein